jgi:MinD superfamily P-loop ATPase
MKEIVVISGKGGTGKTIITASFASLAQNKVMADCDVDAADLHLLVHPTIKEQHDFSGGVIAVIDDTKCSRCGKCVKACRFDAISVRKDEKRNLPLPAPSARSGGQAGALRCREQAGAKDEKEKRRLIRFCIDRLSCEGCGVCEHVCADQAIHMDEAINGEWYISDTKYGPLVHANLGIAEENSGKLVAIVKQNAKLVAEKRNADYIIVDGPPGIGCPVIASLSGADIALIVTEPTLSGIHDMERVIEVANHFGVKPMVCVNKCDLNPDNTRRIEQYCEGLGIKVLATLPFDETVINALVKRVPVVEYSDSGIAQEIKSLWENVKLELKDEN